MRARREGGWSLLEMVVVLAIFSVLMALVTTLYTEYIRVDQDVRLAFFRHPQVAVLTERFGRDVLDSTHYPSHFGDWTQTERVLLIQKGSASLIVWDFDETGIARRIEFENGSELGTWVARGIPAIAISATKVGPGRSALRLTATGEKGELVYDRIFQPRAN